MHSNAEDLKRYALGQLPPTDATLVETHLRECHSCRTTLRELASGTRELPMERRSAVRTKAQGRARIKGLDPLTSIGPSADAQILDTSSKGLKLRAPRRFLPGSIVQIRSHDGVFLGKVKYCNPAGAEFDIGVYLNEDLLTDS